MAMKKPELKNEKTKSDENQRELPPLEKVREFDRNGHEYRDFVFNDDAIGQSDGDSLLDFATKHGLTGNQTLEHMLRAHPDWIRRID